MARTIARDHGAKRAQIRQSAAELFARQGFDRASMAMVAAACGVSKANIYHYYPSKEALLFDLLQDYLSRLRDAVLAEDDPTLEPRARLDRAVLCILLHYKGDNDFHQLQINSAGALPADQQQTLREIQRTIVRHLSDILHSAAPQVFGTDRAKLRAVTMSVFGMLNWYHHWNAGAGRDARTEYAATITALVLGGIGSV